MSLLQDLCSHTSCKTSLKYNKVNINCAYHEYNMTSNSDSCICGHFQHIHFNPILGGKRRPCSSIKCPCLDFKPANSK